MGIDWHLVRMPPELHDELKKLARHFDAMQTLGKMNVPARFADPRGGHVGTPLWFVIRRAMDEWREKKRRSRRRRPAKGSKGRSMPRSRILAVPCKHQVPPSGREAKVSA